MKLSSTALNQHAQGTHQPCRYGQGNLVSPLPAHTSSCNCRRRCILQKQISSASPHPGFTVTLLSTFLLPACCRRLGPLRGSARDALLGLTAFGSYSTLPSQEPFTPHTYTPCSFCSLGELILSRTGSPHLPLNHRSTRFPFSKRCRDGSAQLLAPVRS